MDVAIMIEGQNGLNWPRWKRLATAVEDLGFAGLYRSDHFTNANPPDRDSLECWISLAWLADNTKRIDFGPLVSPLSFREPTILARQAAAVDDLSGGRLTLGLGAGWQKREHDHYGHALLDIPERFDRFEEGLEVITRLLRNDGASDFDGHYYELNDATLLPRPSRPGGPPILIGGNGPRRTLPLAAQFADEWNAVFLTAEQFKERNARLSSLLSKAGRDPKSVRRSLMTGLRFGDADQSLRARGLITGAGAEVRQQLEQLAAAGLQRVMLQWLDLDDLDGLERLAQAVIR